MPVIPKEVMKTKPIFTRVREDTNEKIREAAARSKSTVAAWARGVLERAAEEQLDRKSA